MYEVKMSFEDLNFPPFKRDTLEEANDVARTARRAGYTAVIEEIGQPMDSVKLWVDPESGTYVTSKVLILDLAGWSPELLSNLNEAMDSGDGAAVVEMAMEYGWEAK
jgi:hypothetical protein